MLGRLVAPHRHLSVVFLPALANSVTPPPTFKTPVVLMPIRTVMLKMTHLLANKTVTWSCFFLLHSKSSNYIALLTFFIFFHFTSLKCSLYIILFILHQNRAIRIQ